jgi:Asp/Glu/hydantoin racemase
MRIWYQSFTDPDVHGAYLERLSAYLDEIGGEGTEFRIVGVQPSAAAVHRVTEMRCTLQVLDLGVGAERDGFDAVVVGHFQDSGVVELRCSLDIPVVGMGEASILHALTLGRTFGLVTIDSLFADWHREQVDRIGVRDRLTGISVLAMSPEELVGAFEDESAYAGLLRTFRREAQRLVDAGAEVIVPAGGLFGLLSAGERSFRVGDAVVLNPIAVSIRAAEVAVWLKRHNGLTTSRAGAYAKPPPLALEQASALARGVPS